MGIAIRGKGCPSGKFLPGFPCLVTSIVPGETSFPFSSFSTEKISSRPLIANWYGEFPPTKQSSGYTYWSVAVPLSNVVPFIQVFYITSLCCLFCRLPPTSSPSLSPSCLYSPFCILPLLYIYSLSCLYCRPNYLLFPLRLKHCLML